MTTILSFLGHNAVSLIQGQKTGLTITGTKTDAQPCAFCARLPYFTLSCVAAFSLSDWSRIGGASYKLPAEDNSYGGA